MSSLGLIQFWYGLPIWAQWLIVAVVLLLALRLFGKVADWFIGLLVVLLFALAIWLGMSLIRPAWEPLWAPVGRLLFPRGGPDLALLVATLPVIAWVISLLRRVGR